MALFVVSHGARRSGAPAKRRSSGTSLRFVPHYERRRFTSFRASLRTSGSACSKPRQRGVPAACGHPVDSAGVVPRYRDAAIVGRRQRGPVQTWGKKGGTAGEENSRPFGDGSFCFRPPPPPSPTGQAVPEVESLPAPDGASSPGGRVDRHRWDGQPPDSG